MHRKVQTFFQQLPVPAEYPTQGSFTGHTLLNFVFIPKKQVSFCFPASSSKTTRPPVNPVLPTFDLQVVKPCFLCRFRCF